MIAAAVAAATISLHQAKVSTFVALLRVTEAPVDLVDARHATITVGKCRRLAPGWDCAGALDNAFIDGYATRLCFRVRVRPGARARARAVDCTT